MQKLKRIESQKKFELLPSKFLLPAAYMTKEEYSQAWKTAKEIAAFKKSKRIKHPTAPQILDELAPVEVAIIQENITSEIKESRIEILPKNISATAEPKPKRNKVSP